MKPGPRRARAAAGALLSWAAPSNRFGQLIFEDSNLDTPADGASAAADVLAYGDIAQGFVIVDRIGTTIELIPHLVGSNRRPTGQRGAFMYFRTRLRGRQHRRRQAPRDGRPVMSDRMHVATETFETFLDGRLEVLTAGVDHVRTGHALLARYPDRFRLASGRTLAMRAVEDRAGGEYRTGPGMALV